VLSDACIALATRCLHAPSLYSKDLVILWGHTNRVRGVAANNVPRERDLWSIGRKLGCEDSEERSRRRTDGDPLTVRREVP